MKLQMQYLKKKTWIIKNMLFSALKLPLRLRILFGRRDEHFNV